MLYPERKAIGLTVTRWASSSSTSSRLIQKFKSTTAMLSDWIDSNEWGEADYSFLEELFMVFHSLLIDNDKIRRTGFDPLSTTTPGGRVLSSCGCGFLATSPLSFLPFSWREAAERSLERLEGGAVHHRWKTIATTSFAMITDMVRHARHYSSNSTNLRVDGASD